MIKTLPNLLSLFRILSIPFILMLMNLGDAYYGYAFCLFAVASISDALDGFIARRYNAISKFGVFIDPLADKILVISLLVMLSIITHSYTLYCINILLIVRGVTISLVREWCRRNNFSSCVQVSIYGKVKTFFELTYIGSCLLLLEYNAYFFLASSFILGVLSVFFSYLSCVFYFKSVWDGLTIRSSKG